MKKIFPLIVATTLLFFTACTNRNTSELSTATTDQTAETSTDGSRWYYFSDSGIHPAANPAEIPARTFVPWTEAVRVADAALINKVPALLINRLGLMTSPSNGETPALHTDSSLFPTNTAAGIYNTGNATAIRLYRNSFFSSSNAGTTQDSAVCLALYKSDTGSFSVSLTAADLDLPKDAQCVALDRIGSMWYASFKYEMDSKVQFTYLEFETFPERKSPSDPIDLSAVRKISSDSYQKSVAPFSFADAPDSLKAILSGIPASTGFSLRVYSPLSKSAQTYVRDAPDSTETTAVDGSAFVSDDKTAVLFADGKFYLQSADTGAKVQVLQLPPLSNGYVYTSFIIAGKSLLVAWEEQRFFETGRAGLLEITLPDAVY